AAVGPGDMKVSHMAVKGGQIDDVALAMGGKIKDRVGSAPRLEAEDVVTETSEQLVAAAAAIDDVVAFAPGQHVAAVVAEELVAPIIARSVDIAGAGQDQCLDIVRQDKTDGAVDCIASLTGKLDNLVSDVVDPIDVVSGPADQGVGALTAVQDVIAAT